jgi:glycosyltransferase involved in cell wall biosynthesis
MTEPEIAVILGAYRRSEYLAGALQSVLAQTLPRSAFEVLVVTDRDDPDRRRGLERSGVEVRTDPEPLTGTWLLGAVRATRAPWIAFLDDDDEFEPDRLEAAVRVIREHPDLGFYRNRVRVIDRSGAAVAAERWNPLEHNAELDGSGPRVVRAGDRAAAMEICRSGARMSFNSSTMIVRRELFDGDAEAAFAETRAPDLALAVLAFLSPFSLYLDDARRTRYRDLPGSLSHRFEFLASASDASRRLGDHAGRQGFDPLADWLHERGVHYDRLFRGESVVENVRAASSRREVATGAIDYLRFLGQHPAEWSTKLNVWSAPLYAGSYVLLPGLTRRLAVARPTAART